METALHGAAEAVRAIRDGLISAEDLVKACLERIDRLEEQVGAWAFPQPELALHQAREADAAMRAGMPCGPLHGVPVGVKDIFDTQDLPTEDGTVLHRGRQHLGERLNPVLSEGQDRNQPEIETLSHSVEEKSR